MLRMCEQIMGIKSRNLGYAALLLSVLSLSIGPIIVKSINAPGIVSSFFRMTISAAALTPLMMIKAFQQGNRYISQSHSYDFLPVFFIPVTAGIASAVDHSLWSTAVRLTSVSNASVLNGIAPIWVCLFAWLFLKEKFKKSFWFGLLFIICGAFSMANIFSTNFSNGFNVGDILSLLSSFFYAVYFVMTQIGRRHYPATTQMWLSQVFCAVTIGFFVSLFSYSITGYSKEEYLRFILLGLFSQTGGYFFFTVALGCLPATVVSLFSNAVPAVSALIASIVLKEPFLPHQIFGCIAIFLGIFVINQSKLNG